MNTIFNTCILSSQIDTINNSLIYYSHLIPIFFGVLISLLVLIKGKKNLLVRVFFPFIMVFVFWLVGDLITWVSNNYFLIYTTWSFLVYLEILFYILGFYFVLIFSFKKDILFWQKIVLFVLTLPPLLITLFQSSVVGFDHSICEAYNNHFLDIYKLGLEILIVALIFMYMIGPFIKKTSTYTRESSLLVLGPMFLFLSVFGIAEYLAAFSGNYELHLYSLFVIPIFLVAIIYSIFRLDIFDLKIISTYFIVFGFLILTAIQLFFINDSTERLLTILTIIISIFLSIILFRNLKSESNQRIQIEKLNVDLQRAIAQRESLMHLINHKVKGSLTHTKYIFSEMLQGSFGEINPEVKKMAEYGLSSDDLGIKTIDLILNAANLQRGNVKFDLKPVSFKDIVLQAIDNKKDLIQKKNLNFEINIEEGEFSVNGDIFWLQEVANNLIDNAFNYTNTGKIVVGLGKKENKILFSVKDTGIGLSAEDKNNLFREGGRGKESVKTNVNSTGYGLYSVKLIVEAHKGRVWAESDGQGKGSEFFVKFDAI